MLRVEHESLPTVSTRHIPQRREHSPVAYLRRRLVVHRYECVTRAVNACKCGHYGHER